MGTKTILFSIYSDSGALTAWGPANSTPAFPSGYTLVADTPRIISGRFSKFSGSTNTIILDDTALTGNLVSAEVVLGPITSDSQGVMLVSPAATGVQLLINATNIRVFNISAGILGTQVGSTISFVATGGHVARFEYDQSADLLTIKTGPSGSLVTRGTASFSSANTDWRAGAFTRGASTGIVSLTSDFVSAQSIDTLTDPLVAGTAFSGTSTGFADGAATLSSNGLSVAVTVASGAFSGTWPIAVDAQPYPTLPKAAQTITLTQGADTATITSDLDPPAGTEVVNFVSPITDDDTYPGYYFEQDGFTAEGAQFVFMPYSDLTMAADGEILVTGEGDLIGYLIPSTGTGAGNAYYYTFQISDGGDVISGNRGITAVGLTMSGITMRGITAVGL